MRNKLNKIAMAAGFVLAITFTISCSSDGGGNNPPGSNPGTEISSSEGGDGLSSSSSSLSQSNGSGTGASSSAEDNGSSNPGNGGSQSYDYCIYATNACIKNYTGDCATLIAIYPGKGLSDSCPSSYICREGSMSGKICEDRKECGARSYNPETHFCGGIAGTTIYEKCNGKTYDVEKYKMYKCINDTLVIPCGSSSYDLKTQYCSNGVVKNDRYGTLTYNGQTYKTVGIGNLNWMAENLNYNADGSKCYENLDNNCTEYGRLYNWATAMTACPSGWHLPSDGEWDTLIDFVEVVVGWYLYAGTSLKATSGWRDHGGTDTFGFSALPGGYGYSKGFSLVGSYGYWWSGARSASRSMAYNKTTVDKDDFSDKTELFSVRCVQD